jgi:hypothetical protein
MMAGSALHAGTNRSPRKCSCGLRLGLGLSLLSLLSLLFEVVASRGPLLRLRQGGQGLRSSACRASGSGLERPDPAGSAASTCTTRSPPDRAQPRPGRTGGLHPRRAGRACDRNPCPPCRAGVSADGERHLLLLKVSWHRRAIEASSMPAASAATRRPGLTRNASHGASLPCRDGRGRGACGPRLRAFP